MIFKPAMRIVFFVLLAVLSAGCDRKSDRTTGEDYLSVTANMLTGAQNTGRTGGFEYDDLQWTFDETSFEIVAGKKGMPRDLVQTLLPDDTTPQRFSGRWSVEGEELTLSDIFADGKAIEQPPVTIRTMCTPVIRIQPQSAQYMFRRGGL